MASGAAVRAIPRERLVQESFLEAAEQAPDHLIYLLLNVGDADTQLFLLPARSDGTRRALVVDVGTAKKLPKLLEALSSTPILPPCQDLFPVVVGSHPHDDHIGGMPQFLDLFGDLVSEYWDPGFYHPTPAYIETMRALEAHPRIQQMQPTSGTTRYLEQVKLTVLSPGIELRSRFDTYGTTINDASIALKIDFPSNRVVQVGKNRKYLRTRDPWSILLGADAQTTSWAKVVLDFPQLHASERRSIYSELREAMGSDVLRAQIFKVPHHASKHGVNLELVERIAPRYALISCTGGGGRYSFPHTLAIEAIREGLHPSTGSGEDHESDVDLGIFYTCDVGSRRVPLGSMAMLIPPKRGAKLRMWRFRDEPDEPIELERAVGLNLGGG